MEYKGFTYTPTPKTAWDNLSMLEKSEMIKVAVRNGIYNLNDIREKYNEFAEGGGLEENTNSYQPLANDLKSSGTEFNVDDWAWRLTKLRPNTDVIRDDVQTFYNTVPVNAVSGDSPYYGTFEHQGDNGRINLFPDVTPDSHYDYLRSREGIMARSLSHEENHNYVHNLLNDTYTKEEADILNAGYPDDIFHVPEGESAINEKRATNMELRKRISQWDNNSTQEALDNAIDRISPAQLMNMYFNTSGYAKDNNGEGKAFMKNPESGNWDRDKIKAMKRALKDVAQIPYENVPLYNTAALGGPLVEAANEYKHGGNTVGEFVNAIYENNPREEYLGEPSHHYAVIKPEYIGLSEEELDRLVGKKDKRGHRLDIVKTELHPSHPSRGTWDGDKFILSDFGMETPNYTLFGLNDGGQDPQAVLTYQGGIVLPEITVTPNENYFYNPYDNIILHQKANGGKIHIKPSKRGTFTAAAKKHGKSVQAFASQVLAHPENYSPAMRKKANFARNASHWKHGLGGNLYGDGGILDWFKGLFSFGNKEKAPEPVYRNRPAEKIIIANSGKKYTAYAPKRVSENNSKTKEQSEKLENIMRATIRMDQARNRSNPDYDIPYIPEKSIIINGSTTSTNVLDSLAKYAGEHNRNPQLSEHPRKKKGSYGVPRQINMNEMLGLFAQETHNGAMPYFNYKNGDVAYNRALGNTNYFTAFGYIPAENLVRNFQYNDANVDRNTPPLLDAFRYYAQGDYNTNDSRHTKDVNTAGKIVWQNPAVKDWWETSGKYWYKNGKGPK